MNNYVAPIYTKSMLEELTEDEIHFPFTDDDAYYDGLNHQYRLTRAYFEERGRNLETELEGTNPDKINNFLKYLQMKVYSYIYTHGKSTKRQLDFLIAKRGLTGWKKYEYRQSFLEAMFVEGCYLLDNGDISNFSGVDFGTMQNMSADVMRTQDRDMHKSAVGMLRTLGLNFYGDYCFIPQGGDW